MTDRIILDLCAGTGAWSQPYLEAGYDVRRITLPAADVRTFVPPRAVHGILAAPPCEHFARCGARWWAAKGDTPVLEGLSVVLACLRIIAQTRPVWWALENPIGRLRDYLGPPVYVFEPWWFGDPWTKRTWLWGRFIQPQTLALEPKPMTAVPGHRSRQGQRTHHLERAVRTASPHAAGANGTTVRAITPPAFAQAFFATNP